MIDVIKIDVSYGLNEYKELASRLNEIHRDDRLVSVQRIQGPQHGANGLYCTYMAVINRKEVSS